jgi:hypothetical protein
MAGTLLQVPAISMRPMSPYTTGVQGFVIPSMCACMRTHVPMRSGRLQTPVSRTASRIDTRKNVRRRQAREKAQVR